MNKSLPVGSMSEYRMSFGFGSFRLYCDAKIQNIVKYTNEIGRFLFKKEHFFVYLPMGHINSDQCPQTKSIER